MDTIMKLSGCMNFYEYYFEPSGNIGMVGFQFMNRDYEKGMMVKKIIEALLNLAQLFFYLMIVLLVIIYLYKREYFLVIGLSILLFIHQNFKPIKY